MCPSVDGMWRGRGEGFCGVVVSDYSDQRCLTEVVVGDAQQRASVLRSLHPCEKHCPKHLPGCVLCCEWDGLQLVFSISEAGGEISNLVYNYMQESLQEAVWEYLSLSASGWSTLCF